MTDSLIPYNYNYFFPYITISYASGQWFETAVWERYHQFLRQGKIVGGEELHRVMMDGRGVQRDEWVFFTQERGGTWRNWDNRLFLWVGDHLVLEGIGLIVLVGAILVMLVKCCGGSRAKKRSSVANMNS